MAAGWRGHWRSSKHSSIKGLAKGIHGAKSKTNSAVLCLMAMAFFAGWPVWKIINARPVSSSLYERAKTLADKDPRLQPAWTIAVQDDVLTYPEAKVIVEAAGEKIERDE